MVKTQYSLVIRKISWNPHCTKNKKWSFSLMISSLNVTKSGRNCEFGHIEEILLNGNLHFLCIASDPIMVSSWVQNSVCMRKRQKRKDSICVGVQQRNQKAALPATELKVAYIQVKNKPVRSSESKIAVKPATKMLLWTMKSPRNKKWSLVIIYI